MKKFITVIALVAMCLTAVGCITLNRPIAATSNPIGTKEGTAHGVVLFGVIGKADVGIQEAAKNGGITTISTVDFATRAWFGGVITIYTTIVTGE